MLSQIEDGACQPVALCAYASRCQMIGMGRLVILCLVIHGRLSIDEVLASCSRKEESGSHHLDFDRYSTPRYELDWKVGSKRSKHLRVQVDKGVRDIENIYHFV